MFRKTEGENKKVSPGTMMGNRFFFWGGGTTVKLKKLTHIFTSYEVYGQFLVHKDKILGLLFLPKHILKLISSLQQHIFREKAD